MPRGHDILLLTRASDVERAVADAAHAAQARVSVCHDLPGLDSQLTECSACVVLVDVDAQAHGVLSQLAGKFPRSRFVVLCGELRSDVLLAAMQAGARHCLLKASISAELPDVLRRLLKEFAPAAPSGRLVTVLSTSGGCGATTIAINLGEELRRQDSDPVLLVDLDLHYGSLAGFLGLSAGYGVADVLAYAGAIDDQLVTSTAVTHGDGLCALLGPACVDFSHPRAVDWGRLDDLLAACSEAYPCTVVDAARIPLDAAAKLALASVLTLVVFELSVTGVRGTRALLAALAERQVPGSSVLPVANRWHKRNAMLDLQVAREALGGVDIARVGNDYAGAIRAINFGRPIAHVAPRSPLRPDIQALASRISRPAAADALPRRTVA